MRAQDGQMCPGDPFAAAGPPQRNSITIRLKTGRWIMGGANGNGIDIRQGAGNAAVRAGITPAAD